MFNTLSTIAWTATFNSTSLSDSIPPLDRCRWRLRAEKDPLGLRSYWSRTPLYRRTDTPTLASQVTGKTYYIYVEYSSAHRIAELCIQRDACLIGKSYLSSLGESPDTGCVPSVNGSEIDPERSDTMTLGVKHADAKMLIKAPVKTKVPAKIKTRTRTLTEITKTEVTALAFQSIRRSRCPP
ncbi:hypothetical protein BJ138DRAFT_757712 [Hygrophoropsis aurantiaca]|uniref:Uncharacterized protein n=1 Tax=Hygrophoropsis aurantiaca TaxID=72124 RepID=A0ACB7ZXU6_9AGAM|nr:hypothetical protein BJ138DRAFT_757712 [Hygrophoropsis aurantiaca]